MNGNDGEKRDNAGKSFISKIKDNKKIYYAIACILSVLLILFVFGGNAFSKTSSGNETTDEVSIYVSGLEERLTRILSEVGGVGKVSVAIKVESGTETVIATKTTVTENANGKETVETPILVNGKPVVLKELYPKISGVLIVAEGAGNFSVLRKIQQAAVSFLGVELNKIEILTMK